MPYLHTQLNKFNCLESVLDFTRNLLRTSAFHYLIFNEMWIGQRANHRGLIFDIYLRVSTSNSIESLELENHRFSFVADTDFRKAQKRQTLYPWEILTDVDFIEYFVYPSLIEVRDSAYLDQSIQRLVYYLSAKGRGTRKNFNSVCEILALVNDAETIRTIYRNLMLLDILDSDFRKNNWSIRPTMLIPLSPPTDRSEFYITGAQSIHLYEQIRNLAQAKMTIYSQVTDFAPSRITLAIDNANQIVNFDSVVNLNTEPTQNINSLMPIDQWRDSRQPIGGLVDTQYQWKIFRTHTERFEGCSLPRETGFYEMCNDKISQRWNCIFYNADLKTFIQADWYGMRFLHLHHENNLNECVFNINSNTLAILANQRWPMIYEKALVKFSGLIPIQREINNKKWLLYANIPEDVAQRLTTLLELEFRPITNIREMKSCMMS